jgi:hypothetical protein
MMKNMVFKKNIGVLLKARGFVNKGQSWFLSGDDSTVVLNLQKSDFDERFYVNFGVWLKCLGEVAFPPENKCHIQARLTSLFPEYGEIVDRACTVGSSEDEFAAFVDFLQVKVVPFCEDCLRVETLKAKIEAGEFKKALVMKSAKDALNTTTFRP